jgi:hypothetical protein
MEYIECPKEYEGTSKRCIFVAGSITGVPDWQNEYIGLLKEEDVILFNPRRKAFSIDRPESAEEQISWEHKYLRRANAISFWFCKETIGPIVLYELGAWSMTAKPIFVGMNPEYSRRRDVEIQTRLARGEVKLCYDLNSLAEKVKEWLAHQ